MLIYTYNHTATPQKRIKLLDFNLKPVPALRPEKLGLFPFRSGQGRPNRHHGREVKSFLVHLDSLDESDGRENGFSREFNSIKKRLASVGDQSELRAEAGRERANVRKNRYKDILPFDQTRVPLSLLLDEGYSDYINANFIRGIDGERYYIATQGPLGPTVVDFWRMIWEFSVKVIVMACREVELGKKKCERYWAAEGTEVFGPFTITNVTEETLRKEVTIRTLSVSLLDDAETRSVSQFQYTAWPDHGIPQEFDCLLEMITLLHQRQGQLRAPICVHCSAGCGRTGVICNGGLRPEFAQRKGAPPPAEESASAVRSGRLRGTVRRAEE
ncbi:tyrosine-protein phosphatase non-receptor type 18-like [Heterodontus francisci]|uniref:tyrosine-protein phosphatase non-receptor type 18-like n=1 Tax=Heterodontus francisci TaxID=7792 RepID=UPI00355C245D